MDQPPALPSAPTQVPTLHTHPGPWLACVCSWFHFLPGLGIVITGNLKNGPLGVSLRTHHSQIV